MFSNGAGPAAGDRLWARVIDTLRARRARPWILAAIVTLCVLICWLDFATGPGREPAALYDVPIMMAAVAFGATGALATAGVVTVIYLTTLLVLGEDLTIADLSQSGLFLVLGLTMGLLVRESIRAHALQRSLMRANEHLETRVAEAVEAERGAQRQPRDAQRLTMMGEAAAQIAHEIKNPLALIGGYARRVGRRIPGDAVAHGELTIITEEVERLESLLRDLLEFARPSVAGSAPLEVGALAESALALARPTASERGVRLRLERCGGWPHVVGDADRLKSALLNLVLNGIESMPAGGDLAILIEELPREEGGSVRITVRDTGLGIAPQQLARVFEPFFTTRWGGTGLGLPLVKKTIEAHGGSIELSSTEAEGTSVRISLPLSRPVGDRQPV